MELLTGLGARAERRMTPRLHIALAGAGALIAIGGAVGLGGDNLIDGDGDINRLPGLAISLLLLVGGLAVLTRIRTGAPAVAGSVATAASVPLLVFFGTVDRDGFPPFSFDALVGVSALAWLVLYAVGPARGRMLLLAGALVFAPIFVMEEVEDISEVPEQIGEAFGSMFGASSSSSSFDSGSGSFDENGDFVFPEEGDAPEPFQPFETPDLPDPTVLGLIALAFGAAYLAGGHVLTRRGVEGTGTPLTVVGALSSFAGVLFLGDDLGDTGGGIALVVLGLALAAVGAAGARRFTTWFGGVAVAVGVIVVVGNTLDGADATTASIVFLLVGIAVVGLAHLAGITIGEPAEEDERRSFRPRARQEPGDGPAPVDDSAFAPEG